jgi:hypothetical protein
VPPPTPSITISGPISGTTSGPTSGPVAAERELLRLAREVAEVVRATSSTSPVRAALETVARAYEPGNPLPPALVEVSRDALRGMAAPLGIAWAQEQVRLALEEALAQEVARGRARGDLPLGTLAWLFCAACAATTHESAGAVSERIDALMALIEPHAGRPGTAGDA